MQNSPLTTSSKGRCPQAAIILLISCICGWFMMELEILGVRVLVPYFGSAVYVITGSVIGVFLLSLSVGYMLGGWFSTRLNAWLKLGIVMVIVGICFCAIPFLDEPVCEMIFDFGFDVQWGSLAASLLLFGIPTVLLGTVSPTVMHWLTTQTNKPGFNAGLVLATSTISSFAGCIVTAFYLVLYSLWLTLCVSGVIMIVLGSIVLLAARQGKNKTGNCNEQVS
jgi:hypothetical protein